MTGLVIALLWFPLLGAAFSRLAGRTSWFLAGAGANALALFVAGVLHIPLKPVIAVLGLSAVAVMAMTPSSGARVPRASEVRSALPLWITAFVLLIGAVITPLNDYDGRAFWMLKAKAIAHEQRIDGPFFQLQSTPSPRNQYPLLAPLDAATEMMFARDGDDRHARALFAMFAIALAFEVRSRFAEWFSPSTAVWLATLLLWIPQIETAGGGARSAGADVPLAAFVGCAFFELIEARAPLRLGLWLACLVLTKNEGVPFALVFLAAGVFVFRRRIIAVAILPMLTLYTLAYVVTDWTIAELVRVTATRLLSHFVAPALFLIAAALHVTQSKRWGEISEPSPARS